MHIVPPIFFIYSRHVLAPIVSDYFAHRALKLIALQRHRASAYSTEKPLESPDYPCSNACNALRVVPLRNTDTEAVRDHACLSNQSNLEALKSNIRLSEPAA
jgi:hypothetical protein